MCEQLAIVAVTTDPTVRVSVNILPDDGHELWRRNKQKGTSNTNP
jgi:hypothetical protein